MLKKGRKAGTEFPFFRAEIRAVLWGLVEKNMSVNILKKKGRNGKMSKKTVTPDANANAIISRLKGMGIDAHVVENSSSEPEYIDDDEFYFGAYHEDQFSGADHIEAKLPNGIEVHIVTDSTPDRATIFSASSGVSEIYHCEDMPENDGSEYYPDIACDMGLNNTESISDVVKHIANAASFKEVSYADLITASVQKHFPEKAEEMSKSMLVRDDLTEEEMEMLTRRDEDGSISNYYSPHKTVLISEGETMTKKETEWLIERAEKCAELKNDLSAIREKSDISFQTPKQCVSAVKDCQRFLKMKWNYSAEEPFRYDDSRDWDIARKYNELITNEATIVAALSSSDLEGRDEILSATEKYRSDFLQEARDDYQRELDDLWERYGTEDEIEREYGELGAEEDLQSAEEYAESITMAPPSYVMNEYHDHLIDSVTKYQIDASKALIDQLSADTQGVTHDDVSDNFGKYAIKDFDSAQYVKDRNGNGYLQATYSDGKYFNAIQVCIPIKEFDDPASAVSAAAKYSQTKEEFENEMPNLSYDAAYIEEGMDYVEGAETLGEVRYDSDIDRDEADVILGIEDEPEEVREEMNGRTRHLEQDSYDEFEL